MSLDAFVEDREIVICVGAGGVGKTSVAASVAAEAARRGKKTLVLTIDPARRLASAMGLKELGNAETRIPAKAFAAAGIEPAGELWGMMLDMKRTWDELIARIAPSPEKRDRILENQYYKSLSSALAGSQEYMAMEKLQEIHAAKIYDLIVLDTPPTKHALDFLEAPRRMSDFLEGRVIQILIKPYAMAGKTGFRLMQRGTASIMAVIEKVTGVEVLKDLAEFFLSFDGLYDGFKDRALAVNQLLHSRRTAFLLVASPSPIILREAEFFADKLVEFDMPLGAIVFNRVHPSYLETARALRQARRLRDDEALRGPVLAGLDGDGRALDGLLVSMLSSFLRAQKLADADRASMGRFLSRYKWIPHEEVPFFEDDIHDFEGLARIADYLFEA